MRSAWDLDVGAVDWSLAACKGTDPDAMFGTAAEQLEAKKLCRGCPVRVDCLADAMRVEVQWGVWGGMTDRERRLLRRRHPGVTDWLAFLADVPRVRCGSNAGYQAHIAAGEVPCDPCDAAQRAYKSAYNAGVRVGRPQRYKATL